MTLVEHPGDASTGHRERGLQGHVKVSPDGWEG